MLDSMHRSQPDFRLGALGNARGWAGLAGASLLWGLSLPWGSPCGKTRPQGWHTRVQWSLHAWFYMLEHVGA